MRIFRLITSNSVEEKILERAQFKLDLDGKIIQAGKFDNKSTDMEREAFLKSLLDTKPVDDDNATQDDEELNELLARNENELDIFRKMDKQRQIDLAAFPGRLLTLDELPEAYKTEFNPLSLNRKTDPTFGRNAKKVNYDDTMTEEEYVEQLMEPTKRKSALHSGDSKKQRVDCSRFGLDLLQTIEEDMEGERQKSYLFLELPSKVDYPSYYIQIKNPISMAEIKQKLNQEKYWSLDQVMSDLKLMFNNARQFNVEGSLVVEDANDLEALAFEKCNELKELLATEQLDQQTEQLDQQTEQTQMTEQIEIDIVGNIVSSGESEFNASDDE